MKKQKKQLMVLGCIFVVLGTLCIVQPTQDFSSRNVEALTHNESLPGRWRTVGCGSYNFIDWATYCCPNVSYNNCPGEGDCHKEPIYGCD